MKTIFWPLILLFITSCTYGTLKYGYYWNPITLLSLGEEALENNDEPGWSEILSEKALCVYGAKKGMDNIRSTLSKIDHTLLDEPSKIAGYYLDKPRYVGFYSYYQESYISQAKDLNGKVILKVKILCDFGLDRGDMKYVKLQLPKYTEYRCSVVDIQNYHLPLKIESYCRERPK